MTTSPNTFYKSTMTHRPKVNIPQAVPPPKTVRASVLKKGKPRMVKKKAAATVEKICQSPSFAKTSAKTCTTIKAKIRQVQEQQTISNGKLGSLQCLLQNQKAKIDQQESMLESQKIIIDSQTSELARLKAMLEEMNRRVSDLEQSFEQNGCDAKKRLFGGANTEDNIPQSPMADLSFQSLPATSFSLALMSTPIQASPFCFASPAQASPSCTSTPEQNANPQNHSQAAPTPASRAENITLRTLPADREESFYRNSFVRGEHQSDVYAANVFMSIVPFQTYNTWVKKFNWAGTNGKMALPENVKEQIHTLVSQRFPNLTVDQWHKVRSRVNERLRCPRKVDPETPRHGFCHN